MNNLKDICNTINEFVSINIITPIRKKYNQNNIPNLKDIEIKQDPGLPLLEYKNVEDVDDTTKDPIKTDLISGKDSDNFRIFETLVPYGDPIADGSFGDIYRAKPYNGITDSNAIKAQKWVIKIIGKKQASYTAEYDKRLIKITQGHPNLHPISATFWKPNLDEYWCVMRRFAGKDLIDYEELLYAYCFEHKIIYIIREILRGLEYLHNNGVVHKDIKPENIRIIGDTNKCHVSALVGDFTVLIYDFGLSEFMSDKIYTPSGTLEFIAPEIFIPVYYDGKSDIWSLGITLFSLLTLNTPYEVLDLKDTLNHDKGEPNTNVSSQRDFAQTFKYNCDRKFYLLRLYLEEKAWSEFIIDICMRMLTYDQKARPSATDLLNMSIFSLI